MTEPARGACSSRNKKDQSSFLDEDIPTDFLSSWKSMSVTEDDAMDFNFEPVTKGKIKAFNFDKLDVDFNVHSEIEKLSSFAVDMSHLDFSLPMEKSIKSKEKHNGEQENKSFQVNKEFEKSSFAADMSDLHFSSPEESTKSKEKLEGGHAKKILQRKQENFSFSFDFNELDNFPIDPQLKKECNSSKGEEARGKDKSHKNDKFPDQSTQLSNENGVVEDVQIFCEKSNIIMLNRETSKSTASSDKKESDLAQISPDKPSTVREAPYISMLDRDPSLPPPLSDPKQSDVSPVSSEKLNPARTCEKVGKSHQAENNTSEQSFCQQATLDPSDQSLVGSDSTQAIVSKQMKICPAIDKLGYGLPEEDMCDGKSAASLASYDQESQLKDSHPQCVVETTNNCCKNSEHTEGNKDILGNVEGGTHAETSVSGGPIISSAVMKVDAGKKKAALKPVSGLLYRPMAGKDEVSKVPKFKFPVPRSRTDNIGDQSLSTRGAFPSFGRNKIGSTGSTAVKERNDNGAYTDRNGVKLVGNPKSNAKETNFPSCESERSIMDHYSSREGSNLSVASCNNDLIMMSKACHGEGTKSRPFLLGIRKNIRDIRSSSLQGLEKAKPKASSMASIERLKSNSVEQGKLPSPRPQRNVVDLSSLKILRNARTENQSVASRTEVSSSLKKFIGDIESQATTRMTNPLCIDIKTRSPPSSKRKYSDASYASVLNCPPSKRFSSCESRSPKDASRRITAEEVPGHVKLVDCSSENASEELLASTFDYPRDISMAKLGPPLTLENDKKLEKAEACSKELEDICNTLKRKHEEAKELLVRVTVNNNYLLMLNNPIYDDKISVQLRNFLPDYYPKKFTQGHRVGRLKAKLGSDLN